MLHRPVFAEVASLRDLPPGAMTVADAGGTDVLLANVDGDVYALLDGCRVDGRTLDGGRLTGPVVVCPWHNCAYDVRSGKPVDDGPHALRVVPVAVDGDAVKVAVNVA
ncbi:MAG TPA: Rieske 2Fe-2S domain-containing protein [Solirubrobacteraceae bacterium]|nr:Rieske 2Fe-2S domain-containing protein [Solirubrobacteraceae bacterium]